MISVLWFVHYVTWYWMIFLQSFIRMLSTMLLFGMVCNIFPIPSQWRAKLAPVFQWYTEVRKVHYYIFRLGIVLVVYVVEYADNIPPLPRDNSRYIRMATIGSNIALLFTTNSYHGVSRDSSQSCYFLFVKMFTWIIRRASYHSEYAYLD